MLRGVVSFWLVLGLLIGASLYYFRVNNIAIPYLDEVSVAAPTVVRLNEGPNASALAAS